MARSPVIAWAQAGRALTLVGTMTALGLTAHTVVNLRRLRVPPSDPPPVEQRVSILVPARNEAERIEACVKALLSQTGMGDFEVVILDDHSTDGTGERARAAGQGDSRLRVIDGSDLPQGWLGKPWACAQLAEAAEGAVLVFVDADVTVAPHGVAAGLSTMHQADLDMVCPYPRQVAVTFGERLVQPLLQWSWLTTLPLGLAERSARESLVAANGQLLMISRAAYDRAGGHSAVRTAVLDDIELMRAVKRSGGRGTVVDGTQVASCRMYTSWEDLREGYTKSLWTAFGSPAGAAGALGVLAVAFVVPPVAALTGSVVGAVGVAAGVTGRVLVGRRTQTRVWPDALMHPASVGALIYLTVESFHRRRKGTLTWKGRSV